MRITAVPGDFNGDGRVDAADYVKWRKDPAGNGGDPAGYETWRQNFGRGGRLGSGASLGTTSAVPEPASLLLIVLGAASLPLPAIAGPKKSAVMVGFVLIGKRYAARLYDGLNKRDERARLRFAGENLRESDFVLAIHANYTFQRATDAGRKKGSFVDTVQSRPPHLQ